MREVRLYQSVITRSILGWLKLHGFLALAGVLGPLLILVAHFVVYRSVANYSLVRDSVSLLAWTGMGWFQNASFFIAGFLIEGFSAVLLFGIRGVRGFTLGIILLACSGFSLLLVGAFRTNLPVPYFPHTVEGTIHGIAANIGFMLLPLSSLLIAPSLRKDPYWRPLFLFSIITAIFALIWITVYRLWLPKELIWFGLYERILITDEVSWLEIMAIWLLRLFMKPIQSIQQVAKIPVLDDAVRPNRPPED